LIHFGPIIHHLGFTRWTCQTADMFVLLSSDSLSQPTCDVCLVRMLESTLWTWAWFLSGVDHPVLKICFGPPTAESKNLKNHVNFDVGDLFFRSPALWSSQNVFGPPTAGRAVVDIKDRGRPAPFTWTGSTCDVKMSRIRKIKSEFCFFVYYSIYRDWFKRVSRFPWFQNSKSCTYKSRSLRQSLCHHSRCNLKYKYARLHIGHHAIS